MVRIALCGAFTALSCLAYVANAFVLEQMGEVPAGWSSQGPASSSTTLHLQIALQLSNTDQLYPKLMDVSTPGSYGYGHYLDKEDTDSIFAPASQSAEAVLTWLNGHNITKAEKSSDGHFVNVAMTVGVASTMLNTTFETFAFANAVSKVRTMEYSIPEELVEHIDIISPTVYLGKVVSNPIVSKRAPMLKRQSSGTRTPDIRNCSQIFSPSCIRKAYNVGNYTPDAASGSRVGFGSFLTQVASSKDLSFYQNFTGLPQQNFSVDAFFSGNGGQNVTGTVEADLDVQTLNALTHPLPIVEYVVGNSAAFIPDAHTPAAEAENEPWLTYYDHLLSRTNAQLPQVISNSYGDDEQTVPRRYAHRVCKMIGLLGLRGISVLYSSGDNGLGAICRANDGTNSTRFIPEFPSSCPYVTSVGGTFTAASDAAWNYSGGGFSNYFPTPEYQQSTVRQYLRNLDPMLEASFASYANYSGRAYPEIAAQAFTPGILVVVQGYLSQIGGTSAACPIVAGIIALLNDARFRAGKPAMGFLNPWLYASGYQGLNDVVKGGSVGCLPDTSLGGNATGTGPNVVDNAHFNATAGWDPVTGFGTPNFEKLKELALAL